MVKQGEVGIPRSAETRAKIGIGARETRLKERRSCPHGCEGTFNAGNLTNHISKRHTFKCKFPDCVSTEHKGLGYCSTHKQLLNYCKKFGITVEKYLEDFARQGGTCKICSRPGYMKGAAGVKRSEVLVTDHDHVSGRYRGIICLSCNIALGHFKDNLDVLEKAIHYLKDFNEQQASHIAA